MKKRNITVGIVVIAVIGIIMILVHLIGGNVMDMVRNHLGM